MTFYPERKNHTKTAFVAGIGFGIAAATAGAYAWRKFKETHPNFSLKQYCERCGLAFDECDWKCNEECDNCTCSEPEYEDDCDIEDIEVDMPTPKGAENSSDEDNSDEDEESDRTDLIGENVISFELAKEKVLGFAKSLYGRDVTLSFEDSCNNILLTSEGKSRNCYMFWIASESDDLTPIAVFYIDIKTGEVFDNSEKGMKKISD
ncbi:MAG: hypothetical protein Q8873_05390 [Bacillota bacterium]|nr:hypothetical protein [Bacillota bacterium]